MAWVEDPLRPGQKKQSPVPSDVEGTFNGNAFNEPDEIYSDHIFATTFDFGWGVYAYDVTGVINTDNTLTAVRRTSGNVTRPSAIAGMGLFVIYEQDDIPLTTYWINEGADVIWSSYESWLTPEECTTKANFSGSVFDLDKVNATLWTIVPFGEKGDDMNRLFFNTNGEWSGVWQSSSFWPPGNDSRYVTDYLQPQENDAGLQDQGDSMMPTNAFLILTYFPDLVPSLDNVLPVMAVGKDYDIPIVIDNNGKSDARNFSVCFYVDDELIEKREIVEGAGDGSTIERFSWATPSTPGTIVEFKVVIDPDNTVEELINKYGNGEANNNVTKLVAIVEGERIQIFDTGYSEKPYPSISGIHKGTIVLNHTITVNKMYTYACPGTGGHTKYIEISNESGIVAIGQWTGYTGDWHNISFYPSFRMLMNRTYYYTIHTGSYPQIIHEQNHTTSNGHINCTSFVDGNGFVHNDWIPAIRLWKEEDER